MPVDEPIGLLSVDGRAVRFAPGQTIAAALIAAGRHVTRTTRIDGRPRGLFCGIGGCFDCLITVNGRTNVQSCLEPAKAGDVVVTQRGTGMATQVRADGTASLPREETEIVVVGAGPAGLAAAVAAADAGAAVTIIDAEATAGGQFLRQPIQREPTPRQPNSRQPNSRQPTSRQHSVDGRRAEWRHRRAPADALGRAGHHPNIRLLQRHRVWFTGLDDSGRPVVHALDTERGRERTLQANVVILATGAYDRVVPFPGWDLPRVVTAGAAQALLKGQGVLVGRRVVVAGTGPFLLVVSAALSAAGAQVAALVEANRPYAWMRHLPAMLGAPGKLADAARYLAALRRGRVPVLTGSAVTAVTGSAGALRVHVDRVDRSWTVRAGRPRIFDVDALCVGFGFTPAVELAIGFGCAVRTSSWDGSLVVETDHFQRSSVPNVLAAGEITGIGGADRATAQGRIAGLTAAHATGRLGDAARARVAVAALRTLRAEDRFAKAMHAVYGVGSGWQTWLADDTLLCRCEEVTVARARRDVRDLGADDLRSLKLLSRVGMGLCQGRMCGYAAAELLRGETSRPPDIMPLATRPIATPVFLRVLAGADASVDEVEKAP